MAETCQIALRRLNWIANDIKEDLSKSSYTSIDPAPPSAENDIQELSKILMDEKVPLFERYRAMFSLRNLGTTESINALGEGEINHFFLLFYSEKFECLVMQDLNNMVFIE